MLFLYNPSFGYDKYISTIFYISHSKAKIESQELQRYLTVDRSDVKNLTIQ